MSGNEADDTAEGPEAQAQAPAEQPLPTSPKEASAHVDVAEPVAAAGADDGGPGPTAAASPAGKSRASPPAALGSPKASSARSPKGGSKVEHQKAWENATLGQVGDEKNRCSQMKKTVEGLESKEMERIAAQLAEKRRQEMLAAAREERRKREAARRAEEQLKAEQAADMKRAHEEMMQARADESAALKAATANFNRAIQAEAEAKEIADRMKAMNDALVKIGNAVSKCQHDIRMKFSTMMVCEKRLVMREDKPDSELFKDKVHEALEEELQVLRKTREELNVWVRAGGEVRAEIERAQLLLTTGPSRDNVARRMQHAASLPAITQRLAATPNHQELVKNSYELVDKATQLAQDSLECLARTTEDCIRVTAHVTACFDQRNATTVNLRKSIESQKKEHSACISDVSRRLSLLRMRVHRTTNTAEEKDEAQNQLAQAEALVLEMKAGKKRLEEDYRLKTASFKIDRSCRGLTKVRAGTHIPKLTPLNSAHAQSSPALL